MGQSIEHELHQEVKGLREELQTIKSLLTQQIAASRGAEPKP
jgi:hypothetical protein